jgi:hypothetical protein
MPRDREEEKKLILEDPDFIVAPRYKYSINKFLSSKPNGVEVGVIATLLKMKVSQVAMILNKALQKIQDKLR